MTVYEPLRDATPEEDAIIALHYCSFARQKDKLPVELPETGEIVMTHYYHPRARKIGEAYFEAGKILMNLIRPGGE